MTIGPRRFVSFSVAASFAAKVKITVVAQPSFLGAHGAVFVYLQCRQVRDVVLQEGLSGRKSDGNTSTVSAPFVERVPQITKCEERNLLLCVQKSATVRSYTKRTLGHIQAVDGGQSAKEEGIQVTYSGQVMGGRNKLVMGGHGVHHVVENAAGIGYEHESGGGGAGAPAATMIRCWSSWRIMKEWWHFTYNVC